MSFSVKIGKERSHGTLLKKDKQSRARALADESHSGERNSGLTHNSAQHFGRAGTKSTAGRGKGETFIEERKLVT